jgi:predicted nucleic acid-binding protein
VTPTITDLPKRLKDCRGVLVDSNVLLDVATDDPNWGQWSARALAEVAEHTTLMINPVIYAEVSIGYTTIEGRPPNCSLSARNHSPGKRVS